MPDKKDLYELITGRSQSNSPAPAPLEQPEVSTPALDQLLKAPVNPNVKPASTQPKPFVPSVADLDHIQAVKQQAEAHKAQQQKVLSGYMDRIHRIGQAAQKVDNQLDQAAWQQAREDNPGFPDRDIAGYQAGRKAALQQEIQDKREAAVNAIDDKHFASLIGDNTGLTDAIVQGRDKSGLDNAGTHLSEQSAETILHPIGAATSLAGQAIALPFTAKRNMDLSFMRNPDGSFNPAYKQQVMDLAGGDPNKFKAAHEQLLQGKVQEHDEAPAILAGITNSAMDLLHDYRYVNPATYLAATAVGSGIKSAVKTGVALGHILKTATGIVTGNDDLINNSSQQFDDATKAISQYNDRSPHEGEANLHNLLHDPLSFVDGITGEAARLTGQVGALGGLAGNGKAVSGALEKAGLNAEMNAAMLAKGSIWANSPANKAFTGLANVINGIEQTRLPQYMDNLVSTMGMFGGSMYSDYYSDLRAKGFSKEEAQSKALVRTGIANAAMSLANWTGAKDALKDLPKDILTGIDRESAKTFMGKAGQIAKDAVRATDPKNAALGGLGMGSSTLFDSYQDFKDAQERGEISLGANWNAKEAMQRVGEAMLTGTASMALSHVLNRPAHLTNTPQASAIYTAIADQPGFNASLYRQVQKGQIAPETATALQGLIQRVAPHVKAYGQLIKDGQMSPEAAVQIGIENARRQDLAQTAVTLAQDLKTVREVNPDGSITEKTFGKDPSGSYSEEAGKRITAHIDFLKRQAAESAKTVQQATEGSYVKGRTVSGNELLQLTGNYTPEGRLTSGQAKSILSAGPYHSTTEDISQFENDPTVARYLLMMRNAGDVASYTDARNELAAEKMALLEPHTEKKDEAGNIIRVASEPSEETAKKAADIQQQIADLDKRYPAFSYETKGNIPVDNGKEIAAFQPQHANAPILGADGSIIDGRKRIAYAIHNGEKTIEVVRPRPFEEVAKEVREEHDNTLGTVAPDVEGLPEKQHEPFAKAVEAYDAVPEDAAAATMAAAQTLHEEGIKPAEAVEMLQKVTGHTINEAQAEAFINVAARAREGEVPAQEQTPAVETLSERYKRLLGDGFEVLTDSPLWDKQYDAPKAGIGDEQINDYLHLGIVPEGLKAEVPAPVEDAPMAAPQVAPKKARRSQTRERTRRALSVDTPNVRDRVLQYFASGGRVDPSAIQSLYGDRRGKNISETMKSYIWAVKRGEPSLDGLAHSLWEQHTQEYGENSADSSDFRNAIEDVLGSYTGRSGMMDDLAAQHPDSIAEEQERQWLESQIGEHNSEWTSEAIRAVQERSEEEIDNLLAAEAAEQDALAQQYIRQYEADNRGNEGVATSGEAANGGENTSESEGEDGARQETADSINPGSADAPAAQQSDEPHAGGGQPSDRAAGEQAPTLKERIQTGRTNILVPAESLEKLGWSKKGVNALAVRLRTSFGSDRTIAVIDKTQAAEISGRTGASTPDAWVQDGILYLNIDARGRKVEGVSQGLTPSVVLHEIGHLWRAWAEVAAPELHAKGIDLARQTNEFKFANGEISAAESGLSDKEQKRWKAYADNYRKSHDNPELALADEVLAHGIQEAGKAFTAQPDIKSNFGKWLQSFWTKAKESLGFKSLTARQFSELSFQQFTTRVAHEIGSGAELTRRIREEKKRVQKPVVDANFQAEAQDRLELVQGRRKAPGIEDENAVEHGDSVSPSLNTVSDIYGQGASEPLTKDPVVNALGSLGGEGLIDMIEASDKDLAGRMIEAAGSRDALAQILDNPESAENKEALGIKFRKKANGDRILQDGLLNDGLNIIAGKARGEITPSEIVAGMSRYAKAVAQRETERQKNIAQGKANNEAGKGRANDALVNEYAKKWQNGERITEGELIKKLGSKDAVDKFMRAVEDKVSGAMFSLPDAGDKSTFLSTLHEAADKGENFGSEASSLIRAAFDDGILNTSEARELGRRLHQAIQSPDAMREYVSAAGELINAKPNPKDHIGVPLQSERNYEAAAKVHTALKHAVADEELATRGQARVQRPPQTDEASWDAAKERFAKNPMRGLDLISDHDNDKAFNPTADEAWDMLYEKKRIQVALADTANAKIEADKAGNNSESIRLSAEIQKLESQEARIYKVASVAGSEAGAAFRIRQQMLSEDFSKPYILAKAEAAKGAPLTEPEKEAVEHARVKADTAQRKREARESKQSEQTEAKQEKVSKEKAAKEWDSSRRAVRKRTGERKETLIDRLAKYAHLRKTPLKGDAMYSLPEMDEEGNDISGDVHNIIRDTYNWYAENEPALTVEEVTAKVAESLKDYLPDATEAEIRDNYTGYGKIRKPNTDPVCKDRKGVEITRAACIHPGAGATWRAGVKKRFISRVRSPKGWRELWAKIREAMAKNGVVTTDPEKQIKTALAAAIRHTENEISALSKEISSRERRSDTRSNLVPDAWLIALRTKRDLLKIERDRLLGKKGLTDEQRIALAEKTLERAIAQKKQRIENGLIESQKGDSKVPETDRIKELRKQSNDLTKQLSDLRKQANPPKSKEEIATEAAIKATNRRIDVLSDMLTNNNLKGEDRKSFVDETNQMLIEARGKRDNLQKELDQRRKDAKPVKSPAQIATEAAIKAKQKALDEINRQISTDDVASREKASLVDKENAELKTLTDALEQAREAKKARRDELGISDMEALERWKKMIKTNTEKVNGRIVKQQFETALKKVRVLDDEGIALKAEYERAKQDLNNKIGEFRYANKNWYEKAYEAGKKIQLANKISGVLVLGKLAAMEVTTPVSRSIDESIGHGLSYVPGFSKIGKKAYSEGRVHFGKEAAAYAEGFIHGIKEIPKILKGGGSDLRAANDTPKGFEKKLKIDLIFHIHEALKDPAYEGTFRQIVVRQTENMLAAGINPDDPLVKENIMNTAHQAGLRVIYANDNGYNQLIKSVINWAERTNTKTGHMSPAKAFVGFFIHTMLPVNRVPSNILYEISQRVGGVGLFRAVGSVAGRVAKEAWSANDVAAYKRITVGWERAVDKMTPEDCDKIFHLAKKGMPGLIYTALGAVFLAAFGGKFNHDGADNEDVHEDEINMFGTPVPKWMLENTGFQTMQYSATATRLYNRYTEDEGMPEGTAMLAAGWKSYMGITEGLPFFNANRQLLDVMNAKGFDKPANFASDYLKSNTVPAFLQDIAKMSDKDDDGFWMGHTVPRAPQKASKVGFIDHTWQKIKTGLPVLRESVNKKGSSHP